MLVTLSVVPSTRIAAVDLTCRGPTRDAATAATATQAASADERTALPLQAPSWLVLFGRGRLRGSTRAYRKPILALSRSRRVRPVDKLRRTRSNASLREHAKRPAGRPPRRCSDRWPSGATPRGLQLAQRGEPRERLALELADALARQIELVADRLERPRLALEAEAQLEDPPLALRERVERLAGRPGGAATPRPRRTGRRPRGRRTGRRARPRRPRRRSGSARPTPARRRAPRRRAGSAGRSPRRARPSSPRGRARPRAAARRGRASAAARRRAPARGSCARGWRRRAAPTAGSTRSRTSRTCSRGASRTSRRRGSARAFPPGSGPGTGRPSPR